MNTTRSPRTPWTQEEVELLETCLRSNMRTCEINRKHGVDGDGRIKHPMQVIVNKVKLLGFDRDKIRYKPTTREVGTNTDMSMSPDVEASFVFGSGANITTSTAHCTSVPTKRWTCNHSLWLIDCMIKYDTCSWSLIEYCDGRLRGFDLSYHFRLLKQDPELLQRLPAHLQEDGSGRPCKKRGRKREHYVVVCSTG